MKGGWRGTAGMQQSKTDDIAGDVYAGFVRSLFNDPGILLIGALVGFFPVVINTAVGLTQIDRDLLDLGRVFSAPKWKVFVKIRIPNAYPFILSALKITATSAVVGAIVGEFVASQRGLGYVIIATQSSMNTAVAFAALFWISLMGFLLFGIVAMLTRVLTPWANNHDNQ